MHKEIDYI